MVSFTLFTHPNFLAAATALQQEIVLAGHAVVLRSQAPRNADVQEALAAGNRVLVHGYYEVEEKYDTEHLPSGVPRIVPRAAFIASLSLP